jgi:glycosyltransferase involved in cell wall biosynthesis
MGKSMKLLVISICKDEAKTIGEVLDKIPKKIEGISKIEKWVIDDGSSDNTAEIARKHGAQVLLDGANKKLAFRFREALELTLKREADILVNIDGDLQFDPAEIPLLTRPIIEGIADFAAADRFTDKKTNKLRRPSGMSAGKYYGNKLGARVVSTLSKRRFNDVTCGFRAYNRLAIMALNINGDYTYTQESFQVLAMKRLRIASVPVSIKYYPDRKSRVVTSIFKFIAQSGINILRSYRDFAPLRFFGWLGLAPFVIGFLSTAFFLGHWLATGSFSPYKFLGFTGMYFATLAIFIWGLGLVADMLSRMLNNQEKILEDLKRLRHNK